MDKNQIVELHIEDMSDEGLGIGHTKEGMAVFVKDSVVGDRIYARIVKSRKTYAFGRVEQIITASPDREKPVCPVARSCGGCQIQEMSYTSQLRLKEKKVKNNLMRIGGIACADASEIDASDSDVFDAETVGKPGADAGMKSEQKVVFCPVIGMKSPYNYRNKSVYPVGRDKSGRLIAGFFAGRTHTVINAGNCVIGIEENRYILDAVLGWMEKYRIPEYNEQTGKGMIRNVMIRCGFATGQIMVVVVANADKLPHEAELVRMLLKALPQEHRIKNDSGSDADEGGKATVPQGQPGDREEEAKHISGKKEIPGRQITSIILDTNKERTNVILGRKTRTLWGSDFIEDMIGDVRYQISPLSFYQVNPVQTRKLYEKALEFADLHGNETVWDLYCGIGTISLFLAAKAKQVYGVEVVPDAIVNAKENAKLNHIGNAEFMCGKAEEVLPREYKEHQVHADVIVVDPPRKGLESTVIDTIAAMAPDRVVYVSCNSSTLARDLKLFAEKGYKTERVQPVDMFPHSVHVETVVLMSRKDT